MENHTNSLPRHLGIIMDGNRRWAKEKGLPPMDGHKQGGEVLKAITLAAKKRGIKILTFFCFSTENWQRPKNEVDYLMQLGQKTFASRLPELQKEYIRIRIIGQKNQLPAGIQKMIDSIENDTKDNSAMTLNLALSYGGRAEIVEAVKNIIRKEISPDSITEETVKENLWTSDVDLIIRTGGEQRISGFLLWQSAYSELLFVNKYWPDFTEADLDAALTDFASRQRRFGK